MFRTGAVCWFLAHTAETGWIESHWKKNGLTLEKGESGIPFNFFLTRGNNKLINLLRRVNVEFTDIFKSPELLAENDLTEYINL